METMEFPDTTRRLREVDQTLRPVNMLISAALASSAVTFIASAGIAFVIFATLPLAFWTLRVFTPSNWVPIRSWSQLMLATWMLSIIGGALTTGGTASPMLHFAGLVAVIAHVLLPNRVAPFLGLLIVATVLAVDFGTGTPIELFTVVVAVAIAGASPLVVDRLVSVEDEQRRCAVIDQLTGCLNRHALSPRAVELEAQSRRSGAGIAVVMFDLDGFKRINDQFGHAQGDRVLAHVADVARSELRQFELIYRMGGEEFAIVLPNASEDIAIEIAERIRTAIASSPIDDIAVTASFGVASQDAPFDVGETLERADRCMYRAKQDGRNLVVACSDIHIDVDELLGA